MLDSFRLGKDFSTNILQYTSVWDSKRSDTVYTIYVQRIHRWKIVHNGDLQV